jgi:hypothetical protein
MGCGDGGARTSPATDATARHAAGGWVCHRTADRGRLVGRMPCASRRDDVPKRVAPQTGLKAAALLVGG